MTKKTFFGLAIICFLMTVAFAPAGPAFAEEKPLTFGLLLVGPYNDHGWGQVCGRESARYQNDLYR